MLPSYYVTFRLGDSRLFLFVFVEGVSVCTAAVLVALLLYRPKDIAFTFPLVYVTIFCFLLSGVVFFVWHTFTWEDFPFYFGVSLLTLGVVGLRNSSRGVLPQLGSDSFVSVPQKSKGELVAFVDGRWYNPGLQGMHIVRFERGLCFLVETGKRITDITPRLVFRADSRTVKVDTGAWRYGTLTLFFRSTFDADLAEEALKRIGST